MVSKVVMVRYLFVVKVLYYKYKLWINNINYGLIGRILRGNDVGWHGLCL